MVEVTKHRKEQNTVTNLTFKNNADFITERMDKSMRDSLKFLS